VENIRLAVSTTPATAAPGVAARSHSTTSPSSTLSPPVHTATGQEFTAHQCASSATLTAVAGSTTS
jgi:hypothetical protein